MWLRTLTMRQFQGSLPSLLAAGFWESKTEAASPLLIIWNLDDIILPYAVGQSSHKPSQMQGEDAQTPSLNGGSVKEFMCTFNLPQ